MSGEPAPVDLTRVSPAIRHSAIACTTLGMTNYRIGRIGKHRHSSALNLTTSTRQNRAGL